MPTYPFVDKKTSLIDLCGSSFRRAFERIVLALVLLLSFVLQSGQLAATPDEIVHPDADVWWYDNVAGSLASGCGFTISCIEPTALRDPLYPLILGSLFSLFGHTFFWIRLLQSVINIGSAFLLYQIGKRAWSEWAGVLAATTFTLNPIIIYYSARILSETLANFFILLAVYLVGGKILRHKSLPNYLLLASGMVFGVASLQKAAMLIVPLVLILFLVWHRITLFSQAGLKRISLVVIGLGLTLSPWILRNLSVFGRPILASTSGYAFVANNNLPWPKLPDGIPESERDQRWWAAGRDSFLDHPDIVLRKVIKNLEKLVQRPNVVGERIGEQTVFLISGELQLSDFNSIFYVYQAFIAIGLYALVCKWNLVSKFILSIIGGLAGLFAVFGLTAFWRFHVLIFPWFSLLSGIGVVWLLGSLKKLLEKRRLQYREWRFEPRLFVPLLCFVLQSGQISSLLGSRYIAPSDDFQVIFTWSTAFPIADSGQQEGADLWTGFCHKGRATTVLQERTIALQPMTDQYNCRLLGPQIRIRSRSSANISSDDTRIIVHSGQPIQLIAQISKLGGGNVSLQLKFIDFAGQTIRIKTGGVAEDEQDEMQMLALNYIVPSNVAYVVPGIAVWNRKNARSMDTVFVEKLELLADLERVLDQ